jgi:predicted acylesterase/phospholipase RssA
VDESIDAYIQLSKSVFEVDQVLNGVIPNGDDQCRFDHKQLEGAIKDIVKKKSQDENATMADTHPSKVPTFVVANKALHADGPPTLFRSYQCKGHNSSNCTIWQAGRATSAAPTFFKPIKIETPSPGGTFVDGGLLHNNPSELALLEAEKIWPRTKKFCLVSLGTGRLSAVRLVEAQSTSTSQESDGTRMSAVSGFFTSAKSPVSGGIAALEKIAEACMQLVTRSEHIHQSVFRQSESTDPEKKFPYIRFNVERDMQDIGFQEWYKMEEMAAHTAAYMEDGEGERRSNECVQILMNPPTVQCKCLSVDLD